MALVNVTNISVLDNPAPFKNPFQFEVTFECLQLLEDDLEWKVIYVGNAEDSSQDQLLEEVMVGPVPVGINKFVLQADPPNSTIIPDDCLLGVTVVLVTCSYRDCEFLRIGYYVNNEYQYSPEQIATAQAEYRIALETFQQKMLMSGQPQSQQSVIQANGQSASTDAANPAEGVDGSIPLTEALQPPQLEMFLPQVPAPIDVSRVNRNILAEKPRVTRFPIDWAPRGTVNNDSLMSFRSDQDNDSRMDM